MRRLLKEAIGNFTVEDWEKFVQHAEEWEEEADYCESGMRDEVVQQVLMIVRELSSSEDEDGFQTEDEDDSS